MESILKLRPECYGIFQIKLKKGSEFRKRNWTFKCLELKGCMAGLSSRKEPAGGILSEKENSTNAVWRES
jgi:hypothetical protein